VHTPLYPWLHDPEHRRVQVEHGHVAAHTATNFLSKPVSCLIYSILVFSGFWRGFGRETGSVLPDPANINQSKSDRSCLLQAGTSSEIAHFLVVPGSTGMQGNLDGLAGSLGVEDLVASAELEQEVLVLVQDLGDGVDHILGHIGVNQELGGMAEGLDRVGHAG
jgi:hypothetical protein